MGLIGKKPDIDNPEWHGYFLHISQHTTMDEIESAILEHYDYQPIHPSQMDVSEPLFISEFRVYNESSSYKSFTPKEKKHIGFVRLSVVEETFKFDHLTKYRKPIVYKEWYACEFYQGR